MTHVYRPEWLFDDIPLSDPEGKGERAVQFLRLLKHPKSDADGQALDLAPFFERLVRRVYGDTDANGRRKIKTVFVLLPRGNRKTTMGAALALLHTVGPEKVPGGQCISAASDREQARLAFDEAKAMIELESRIEAVTSVRDYKSEIEHDRTNAVYKAVSADGKGKHGKTPTFVLADELHVWENKDLWEALRTGLVKTAGSILWVITTAGKGQQNLAFGLYDYAKRVASGDIDDPAFLPVLFEAAPDDDWRDEAVWHKVNPGLQYGYPDIEGMRQLAREADARPAERDSFKQLHLNMWLDYSASPFVDMATYDRGAKPVDLEALRGQPCWIGVDLSSTTDLTAVVAAWGDGDEYFVHPWFFCPADNLRKRAVRDKVPYPAWQEAGHIEATPGNVIDYRYVEDRIRQICEEYDVREIAFDPHMARQMMNALLEDGYPVVEFRQGWVTMAPAIKELERLLISNRITHGAHPILRWHFDNIATETDKAGNKSFHKGKSRDRIDGAVATTMAVARASAGEEGGSWYDSDEADEDAVMFI